MPPLLLLQGYRAYYEQLLQLVRPGGVIVVDNTLWYGRVADPEEVRPRAGWRSLPPTCAVRRLCCAGARVAPCPHSPLHSSPQSHCPLPVLPCPQNDRNTTGLRELNDFLLQDDRIAFSLVPVGDGMALCTKL